MRILLTNDDGMNSLGLNALARELCKSHELYIVTPHAQRSGSAHSLTFHSTVEYTKIQSEFSADCYSVDGTPADCVKLASLLLFKNRLPDLVISGINEGSNLGSDTIYSGTVSAALEGAYLGLRSIAVSLCGWNSCHDASGFDRAAKFISDNLEPLLSCRLDRYTILSINYPTAECKGTVVTKVGFNYYSDWYCAVDKDSTNKVQLLGEPILPADEDTDVVWSSKNFATISPITLDRNDCKAIARMKGIEFR